MIKVAPQTQKPVMVTVGPFDSMRDSLDPTAAMPNKAVLAENAYPLQLPGASLIGRPGFQQAGTQRGASNKRTAQLITQFTTSAGTEYTVAITGGQGIDTFNWATATRAWTNVVTVANLTTASITLSETNPIYAVTFTNKLYISDGVNVPFLWDGTTGAGGLTKLTNSPVIYGQPWVYYAKVFGIKNTDKLSMVWSEENDATIGYDTPPYSNVWTLGQTDQNALQAGVGTNERMYYFRGRSAGAIAGAVTSEFKTDGVHDSVADNVGTVSPFGTVYHEGRVFFVSASLEPFVIEPGKIGVTPLWEDIAETVGGLDPTYASTVQAVYHPVLKLVLFAVPETGHTLPNIVLAIDPNLEPPSVVSIFRGYTVQRMGLVKNLAGDWTLMHASNDGYIYDHGLPDGTIWNDGLNAGTAAITHTVTAPAAGQAIATEKRFDRVDIAFRAPSNMTNTRVRWQTPRGLGSWQTFTITSSQSKWDIAVWDTDKWSAATVELHKAVGINAHGRWVQITVDHSALGEQFGLEKLQVAGVLTGDAQGAP